jgi:hypothetical protein
MRCKACNKRLTLDEEDDSIFFHNDGLCYTCREIALEFIDLEEG